MSTGTVAKYTPDFESLGRNWRRSTPILPPRRWLTWAGGDIGVTVTTDKTANTSHRNI